MISPKGQVKIMDFGIARMSGGSGSTWTGGISGTIAYMSPEQAMGGPVDGRTDLWSLGVVLYEMLTGELPFRGDTEAGTFHSLVYESPRPILEARPDCPPDLAAVVDRCLRKKVDERYGSARELLKDLHALKAHARPVCARSTAKPWGVRGSGARGGVGVNGSWRYRSRGPCRGRGHCRPRSAAGDNGLCRV